MDPEEQQIETGLQKEEQQIVTGLQKKLCQLQKLARDHRKDEDEAFYQEAVERWSVLVQSFRRYMQTYHAHDRQIFHYLDPVRLRETAARVRAEGDIKAAEELEKLALRREKHLTNESR